MRYSVLHHKLSHKPAWFDQQIQYYKKTDILKKSFDVRSELIGKLMKILSYKSLREELDYKEFK